METTIKLFRNILTIKHGENIHTKNVAIQNNLATIILSPEGFSPIEVKKRVKVKEVEFSKLDSDTQLTIAVWLIVSIGLEETYKQFPDVDLTRQKVNT